MAKDWRRLPDAELEVMLIVWELQEPVRSVDILKRLSKGRQWALTTLLTVLSRLVEKGFLCYRKMGRYNIYWSLISEFEYKMRDGESMLEKLYGNSLARFIRTLYHGQIIDTADLNEVYLLLRELEKEQQAKISS